MAEFNLSKWLKDDLGLKHMSEVDMNNLVYHPRHGSLCRRLIKFWTESTLCTKKYPNFYAHEECREAESEFKQLEDQSQELLLKLETRARVNGNTRNELNFLTDQHKCLVSIEDMLRSNTEALEKVISRPNFNLIQLGRQIEEPKYLGDLSLESICKSTALQLELHLQQQGHQHEPSAQAKLQAESIITRRDMAAASEECERLETRAQVMHEVITRILADVREQVDQSGPEIQQMQPLTERTNVQQLEALQVPECQQVVEVETEPEERQLREERERLVRELTECNQQVDELAKQYLDAKGKSNERYKWELDKDLALLKSLHQKEAAIRVAAAAAAAAGKN